MGAPDYHEGLWEQIPEGLQPQDFPARLAWLLARVRPGERVLDVGCGEGRFAAALLDAGAQVVGIDVAEEPLRRARAERPEFDLRRVPVRGEWPLPDASFDAVWAGETIEHVADTAAWLSEVRRVLRPEGRLLLSTPAHGPLTLLHLALSRRAFAAHFNPRSDHLRFYSRTTLVELLEDFGFLDVETTGLGGLSGAQRTLLVAARRAAGDP
jgi:2-polyprenyl-3-methyl-5-hydroxy-6-metoxy-1,4-benzoquinol methylase